MKQESLLLGWRIFQAETQVELKLLYKIGEHHQAQCLKIFQKVSFDIASEASYVYILSGQKFIKNAKNGQLVNLKLAVKQCYQTGQFK